MPFALSLLSHPVTLDLRDHIKLSRAVLATLLLAGCNAGDSLFLPGDGQPAIIRIVQGDGQSGRVGERLNDPLVVRVTDSQGRPVQGASVAFELTDAGPGAEIEPTTATTDAHGEAEARFTLGTRMGPQMGEARVVLADGSQEPKISFTVTALSENANGIAAVSGDDQSGPAGSILPDPLVIEVTDVFGNPISGVSIDWVAVGGGSVSEASVTTDDQGQASVERRLGPAAGQQTTLATSPGLAGSPVTFTHTATAGNASALSIISGNNQTAQAGTQLPADLVVRLVDADGNGVSNTAVTWVVGTGGGSVTPENGMTDEAGRSSAQWTLGPNPGGNRVNAVVSGVGVVTFTATGTAAAPAALFISTQPSSTSRNGQRLERQPVVQVRDTRGNNVAISGVEVTAQLSGGGGELSGTRQRGTDSNGRAIFTDLVISGATGQRTLVFTASGYAGATSDPIEVRAISTTTTITSDSPDPSVAGSAFTVEFRVTSDGATPTGSVTISVNDSPLTCSNTLQGGVGSCSLALNQPGDRTLRATYAGGPGFNGSSDTESHRVRSPAPAPTGTTTTITGDSPDPSNQGAAITVSFTVTSPSGTPSGTVQVTDPSGGSCTGNAPSGSCSYTPSGVGPRTITAAYQGNSSFSGSSDTEEHTVSTPPPENKAPDADFNWHCDDLDCQFTDQSTDPDGNGTIASWAWNFGDPASGSNNTSNAKDPSHTYTAPGTYTVTLTVTDNVGASSTASTRSVKTKTPENKAPHAEFEVACPNSDLTCTFTDQSRDDDGSISNWHWDFGDGQTLDGQSLDARNPSHTYAAAQTYGVALTVTDNSGASDSKTHDAHPQALPPPPPAATTTTITGDEPDPSNPTVPITVSFAVTSASGTPTGNVRVTEPNGGGCSATVETGNCSFVPVGEGVRTLMATYEGNSSFNGSSDTEDHTVTPAPIGTTTTITGDDPDPSVQNTEVTVSFVVTSSSGVPNGDVTVSDGTDSCTGSLDGSGQGSCSVVLRTAGPRILTATYPGNSTFAPSSVDEDHIVNAPNQAPSFTLKGAELSANREESVEEKKWARDINPGSPNESGQELTFLLSPDRPDLFSMSPSISPEGTLSFTTSSEEGDSIVTVQLQDNGGTANGGMDTSAPQTFTIHIRRGVKG